MGLWAKSVVIFNAIRAHGKQSVRRLAERTGLSKSSVHRHLQAVKRRDRDPESSLWETEAGRTWLIRLVVATLFVFGLVYPASRFSALSDVTRPELLPPLQPHQFWLSVGTLEPRKNHRRLLQAYARLKTHLDPCMPLVLAGGRGWLMDDLELLLQDLDLQRDVILLGYVDDATLQWLYQHCFAFVYPSLFEGFGLPVLEAMSLGAPIITSGVTSLPEIVGDAGILVDPRCEEAVYGAMRQLATDAQCRTYLRDKARRQAALFSWPAAAQAVLAYYQEVLTNPRQTDHTRRSLQ